ncbi:N-acetyltransferase [Gemmatimonadetes bacterium T265]|nr:N-acetyltransferase [Gemmatimonadetes bacterium T265]
MPNTTPGVPRLTTDRLLLRGFDARDFGAYAALMADPAVARYLGDGRPLARADAWRQLALVVGHWALRGFGLWAAEERMTGALVGRIGCYEPEGWPGLEVGYVLARPYWGRGYAAEGARAALGYAHDVLGRERVVSLIHPENVASVRVATRLGAAPDGTADIGGRPALVYAYPAPAAARLG